MHNLVLFVMHVAEVHHILNVFVCQPVPTATSVSGAQQTAGRSVTSTSVPLDSHAKQPGNVLVSSVYSTRYVTHVMSLCLCATVDWYALTHTRVHVHQHAHGDAYAYSETHSYTYRHITHKHTHTYTRTQITQLHTYMHTYNTHTHVCTQQLHT